MSNPADNPLFKHFRQPAIYLRLPSGGKFYPNSAIDFPPIGEIPVYPMTVKDELTLKTPDALMNGEGMISVVKSCCPNIKNPWAMPAVDVEAVFIAIRLASYGEGMDLGSTCPHCNSKNEHTVDLRQMLDNITPADFSQAHSISDLKFRFRPQSYSDINKANIISFEEQRLVSSIVSNTEISEEEKLKLFNTSFDRLKQLNIEVVQSCIESITTSDGTVVSDPALITEFLDNASREVYAEIKKIIESMIEANKIKPVELVCDSCTKHYTSQLVFDQANFFA